LEHRTRIRPGLDQLRPLGERGALRQTTEIHLTIRAWIHFRFEVFTARRHIVHE
jgi:hypothetical protein